MRDALKHFVETISRPEPPLDFDAILTFSVTAGNCLKACAGRSLADPVRKASKKMDLINGCAKYLKDLIQVVTTQKAEAHQDLMLNSIADLLVALFPEDEHKSTTLQHVHDILSEDAGQVLGTALIHLMYTARCSELMSRPRSSKCKVIITKQLVRLIRTLLCKGVKEAPHRFGHFFEWLALETFDAMEQARALLATAEANTKSRAARLLIMLNSLGSNQQARVGSLPSNSKGRRGAPKDKLSNECEAVQDFLEMTDTLHAAQDELLTMLEKHNMLWEHVKQNTADEVLPPLIYGLFSTFANKLAKRGAIMLNKLAQMCLHEDANQHPPAAEDSPPARKCE